MYIYYLMAKYHTISTTDHHEILLDLGMEKLDTPNC